MRVLQVTLADVFPPSNGSDHRSHALLSACVDAGDEVRRFCQIHDLSTLRSLDFRTRVEITENYIEHRSANPFYEGVRIATPLLTDQSSVHYLGRCLRWWPPRRLRRLVGDADVVLVREPRHVPPIVDVAEDTPVLYSVHGTRPDGAAFEQRALARATAVIYESEWTEAEYDRRFDVPCDRIIAPVATYRSNVRDSFAHPDRRERTRRAHGLSDETLVGLFVGTVHSLNVEAAEYLLDLAREAQERGIDFHLFVAGTVGNELPDGPENVTVLGFVDDLEPYFDAADVGLNPATESEGGPNIKMLDYLARSLPVVSTSRGVRGLDVTSGEEVLVAPRSDFLNQLRRLRNDETAREMGARGRAFIERQHTWDRVSAKFREDLRVMLEEERVELAQ